MVNTYQSLVPEILGNIFLYCLPTDRWINPQLDHYLTNIQLVCIHWHNVVISTPSLWSSVNIEPSSPDGLNGQLMQEDVKWARTARLFMVRSGTAKLSVTFSYGNNKLKESFVPKELILHADRWKTMCLLGEGELIALFFWMRSVSEHHLCSL